MKKLRQIIKTLLSGTIDAPAELNEMIWQADLLPAKDAIKTTAGTIFIVS